MSLSVKERILKLRETEFKLQKLHNDLLNGNNNNTNNKTASMAEFLSHHKELMALPGSNRDSLPFRFSFESPGRYVEMKQTQKLTLPPKLPATSANRLKPYKDSIYTDELKNTSLSKVGLAGHRSLALQTLLRELDKQTSRLAVAFPNLDKLTLLNKTPFLASQLNRKSKRYVNTSSLKSSPKSLADNKSSTIEKSKLFAKPLVANTKSKKVKLVWNHDLSETASTATASELQFGIEDDKLDEADKESEDFLLVPKDDSKELRESVAYALGASNLMGVILPSSSTHGKRGPDTWGDKKVASPSNSLQVKNGVDDNDSLSAKEAVTVLRRRKLPERRSPLPKIPSPHERGLIGVEISNFEPQCAFFYRDRNGNYNPHLHHSKNVTGLLQMFLDILFS